MVKVVGQDNTVSVEGYAGKALIDPAIVLVGKDGKDGKDGVPGPEGLPGRDGVDGVDGKDGKDGRDGVDGKDGISYWIEYDKKTNTLIFKNDGGKKNPEPVKLAPLAKGWGYGAGRGGGQVQADWNQTDKNNPTFIKNKPDISSRTIILSEIMPDIDSVDVGKIYMYAGKTNQDFTHGYIYEVIPTETSKSVEFSSDNITWAVDDFVNYLKEGGDAWNEVTHGTLYYDDIWTLTGYNSDNVKVITIKEYTEDLEDFGCVFDVPPQREDSSTFTLTTEQTGKKWKRIDVQPGGQLPLDVLRVSDILSSVDSSTDNTKPVGGKLFYDTVGNIETILHNINSGS